MIEQIYDWVEKQITTNDVFAGLVGGSVLVSLLYSLKSVPQYLWRGYVYNFTTFLSVRDVDDSFQWFDEWLSKQDFVRRSKRLSIVTKHDDEGDHWNLSLGHGRHFFWYKRKFVVVERELGENDQGRKRETLNIRIATKNQDIMRQLVSDVRNEREKKDYLTIHTCNGGYWRKTATKLTRDLDSVVLPDGQMERIIENVDWFNNSKEWYVERGIPYRYGILLSGDPGCGKTSIASALASHYQRPIYALNLGSFEEDGELLEVMSMVPSHSILLIEDVDSVKASNTREKNEKEPDKKCITLGALLNSIDGMMATEGRILIMTTNYPEKLDSALIRPGRIDLHERIGKLEESEAIRMFNRFFPGENITELENYEPKTPAELQGVMMQNINNPKKAKEEISRRIRIGTNNTVSEVYSQDTLCQMD